VRFKAVIFDLGGVVVNMDFGPELQTWLKRLKLTAEEIHNTLWGHPSADSAMRGEISAIDYWKIAGRAIGLEKTEIPIFMNDYYGNASPDTRVLGLIQKLKNQGVKVGLLSHTMDDADQAFKELGFLEFFDNFDTVILSHHEGMAKPAEAIYLLACKRLGVDPSEAVHIDDMYENIEGARKTGLAGWHYHQDSFSSLEEFLFADHSAP
jgi:epoxide hydrolase-like predicted phosphatase